MSVQFRPAVLAAAIVLFAPALASAHPQDAALNGVYGRLADSRAGNDVQGMASAFHPQALLIGAQPGPALKGADLAATLAPQRDRLVRDGVKIATAYRIEARQVLAPDLAVDAGYMRQALKRADGAEQVRYSRFLVTLRREGGAWRIVGDASLPATAEAWNGLAAKDGLRFDP